MIKFKILMVIMIVAVSIINVYPQTENKQHLLFSYFKGSCVDEPNGKPTAPIAGSYWI